MNSKGIAVGKQNVLHSRWVRLACVIVVIAGCLGAVALPPVRETVHGWFAGKSEDPHATHALQKSPELIQANGHYGLRVNPEAMEAYEIKSVEVKPALEAQPLPSQVGQVMYDNDRLFEIRARAPGEVVEFKKVIDSSGSAAPTKLRPIRYLDKVRQGDMLVAIWSKELGEKKQALVDAVVNLQLSQRQLKRLNGLAEGGVAPTGSLEAAQNQFAKDRNAMESAESTLVGWKVPRSEIDKLKEYANGLVDEKVRRNPEQEKNWVRVEHYAPVFDDDPRRELVVVEKNVNLGSGVDPARDTPLLKLADLSRLQIWVHLPPEYLPRIREQIDRGTRLKWQINFPVDPPNAPPLELDILQVAPSIDPNNQRAMLIGYLPNPGGKRMIGDPVSAKIFLPPDSSDTVEIPTDALNQVEGQDLVFVQAPNQKNEFFLRRVSIVKSFYKVTFVRSKLTPEEQAFSKAEVDKGRRPLEPLLPGERVITRGVLEFTSFLDDAVQKAKAP
jgi:cobalt-zinc-cadmium efflux system membrane fusion protein